MKQLLELAQHAALEAGKAIMEVYAQPFEVYTKDDNSPVTQADLRASNIIKDILKPTGLNTAATYFPTRLTLIGESGEVKQKFGSAGSQVKPPS